MRLENQRIVSGFTVCRPTPALLWWAMPKSNMEYWFMSMSVVVTPYLQQNTRRLTLKANAPMWAMEIIAHRRGGAWKRRHALRGRFAASAGMSERNFPQARRYWMSVPVMATFAWPLQNTGGAPMESRSAVTQSRRRVRGSGWTLLRARWRHIHHRVLAATI